MTGESIGAEQITLDTGEGPLSALLARPADEAVRGTLVALHGGGMRAGYFDARATRGLSLAELGAQLGWAVLAVDRPGYAMSASWAPRGLPLAAQRELMTEALESFAAAYPVGAGLLVAGHSYGGKLALELAAAAAGTDTGPAALAGQAILGVAVSGCGHRPAVDIPRLLASPQERPWRLHWGPPQLYPPGTFDSARALTVPVPVDEAADLGDWPARFHTIAGRITVPAHVTFAEHERWWRHDSEDIATLTGAFVRAPWVDVDRQRAAGHNVSLGWTARAHHLKMLSFADECLVAYARERARVA